MHRVRSYAPAIILLLGCAALLQTHTQAAIPLAGSLESVFPHAMGYTVTNQKLSVEEERVAGMTAYVARAFTRDTSVAFTTLVSYYDRQTQGKTIHSPRNCLPGAGWEIMRGGMQRVAVLGTSRTVNRYVLRHGRSAAVAYYWYQGRGRVTANEYAVKWNLLRDAAFLGHTEEALVRVVFPLSMASMAMIDDSHAELQEDVAARQIVARLIVEVASVLPQVE